MAPESGRVRLNEEMDNALHQDMFALAIGSVGIMSA